MLCVMTVSCFPSSGKTKVKIIEARQITLNEFKNWFAEENLYRHCYYYYGNKDGFIYLSIDVTTRYGDNKPKNPYAWEHYRHGWMTSDEFRYVVPEEHIEFTPKFEFAGYTQDVKTGQCRRIVLKQHSDGAIYMINK